MGIEPEKNAWDEKACREEMFQYPESPRGNGGWYVARVGQRYANASPFIFDLVEKVLNRVRDGHFWALSCHLKGRLWKYRNECSRCAKQGPVKKRSATVRRLTISVV